MAAQHPITPTTNNNNTIVSPSSSVIPAVAQRAETPLSPNSSPDFKVLLEALKKQLNEGLERYWKEILYLVENEVAIEKDSKTALETATAHEARYHKLKLSVENQLVELARQIQLKLQNLTGKQTYLTLDHTQQQALILQFKKQLDDDWSRIQKSIQELGAIQETLVQKLKTELDQKWISMQNQIEKSLKLKENQNNSSTSNNNKKEDIKDSKKDKKKEFDQRLNHFDLTREHYDSKNTVADGSCAFHSILGEWNGVGFFDNNIVANRKKMADKIRTIAQNPQSEPFLFKLIVDAVINRLGESLAGRSACFSEMGTALWQSLKLKDDQEINEAWEAYSKKIHDDIKLMNMLKSCEETDKKLKEHQAVFKNYLSRCETNYVHGAEILKYIEGNLELKSLKTAYSNAVCKKSINASILNVYADHIENNLKGLGAYMFIDELNVMSQIFKVEIYYYMPGNDEPCKTISQPGQNFLQQVCINFLGAHYERMLSKGSENNIVKNPVKLDKEITSIPCVENAFNQYNNLRYKLNPTDIYKIADVIINQKNRETLKFVGCFFKKDSIENMVLILGTQTEKQKLAGLFCPEDEHWIPFVINKEKNQVFLTYINSNPANSAEEFEKNFRRIYPANLQIKPYRCKVTPAVHDSGFYALENFMQLVDREINNCLKPSKIEFDSTEWISGQDKNVLGALREKFAIHYASYIYSQITNSAMIENRRTDRLNELSLLTKFLKDKSGINNMFCNIRPNPSNSNYEYTIKCLKEDADKIIPIISTMTNNNYMSQHSTQESTFVIIPDAVCVEGYKELHDTIKNNLSKRYNRNLNEEYQVFIKELDFRVPLSQKIRIDLYKTIGINIPEKTTAQCIEKVAIHYEMLIQNDDCIIYSIGSLKELDVSENVCEISKINNCKQLQFIKLRLKKLDNFKTILELVKQFKDKFIEIEFDLSLNSLALADLNKLIAEENVFTYCTISGKVNSSISIENILFERQKSLLKNNWGEISEINFYFVIILLTERMKDDLNAFIYGWPLLSYSIQKGSINSVTHLLQLKVDINLIVKNQTFFSVAVQYGDVQIVKALLGSVLYTREQLNNFLADNIKLRKAAVVSALLEFGADPNYETMNNHSMLELAAADIAIIQELLKYKVKLGSKEKEILSNCSETKVIIDQLNEKQKQLVQAIETNDLEMVKKILDEDINIDINYFDEERNLRPIQCALIRKNFKMVAWLINKEANYKDCPEYKKLTSAELKLLSEANTELFEFDIKSSVYLLRSQTILVSKIDKNEFDIYDMYEDLFGCNQNNEDYIKYTRPILQIARFATNLSIVYDPKKHDTSRANVETEEGTIGNYSPDKQSIQIAGKSGNYEHVRGTVIHEFCHMACELVWSNERNPFNSKSKEEKQFLEIVAALKNEYDDSKTRRNLDVIVQKVFNTGYLENKYARELIVRVPQIIATHGLGYAKKLCQQSVGFSQLMQYYEKNVLPSFLEFIECSMRKYKASLYSRVQTGYLQHKIERGEPVSWGPEQGQLPSQDNEFVGREKLLQDLHKYLNPDLNFKIDRKQKDDNSNTHLTVTACKGLGGIGKTQLAIRYTYTSSYKLKMWFPAENIQELEQNIIEFAKAIGYKSSVPKIVEAKHYMNDFLAKHTGWLLIFDNAETYEKIKAYIPKISGGAILITTRHDEWPLKIFKKLEIDLMSFEEATELMEKLIGKRDPNLKKLVEILDRLPLALAQAGAYIQSNDISVETYIREYDKCCASAKQLLGDSSLPSGAKHDPVLITWELSIRAIELELEREKQPVLARILLTVCSYLAADNIPTLLLEAWLEKTYPNLRNSNQITQIVRVLLTKLNQYHLIKRNEGKVKIHRVVQYTMRVHYESNKLQNADYPLFWYQDLMQTCHQYFHDAATKAEENALYPHMECLINACKPGLENKPKLYLYHLVKDQGYILLYNFFQPQQSLTKYEDARKRLDELYSSLILKKNEFINERILILEGIANSYGELGDFSRKKINIYEAKFLAERFASFLTDKEKVSIDVNLGISYAEFGEYQEAKKLLENGLAISRKIGDELNTAKILTSLVTNYCELGEVEVALEKCEEALKIFNKLSSDDPTLLIVETNKGMTLCQSGKFEDARVVLENVLDKQYKNFKERPHADLAITLINLGWVYSIFAEINQSNEFLNKAHSAIQKALGIRRILFGDTNIKVASALTYLGKVLILQKKFPEAKTKLKEALDIKKSYFGKDHTEMRDTLRNLGEVCYLLKETDEARKHLSLAFQLEQSNQIEKAKTLFKLAEVLKDLDLSRAIEYLTESCSIFFNRWGNKNYYFHETENRLKEYKRYKILCDTTSIFSQGITKKSDEEIRSPLAADLGSIATNPIIRPALVFSSDAGNVELQRVQKKSEEFRKQPAILLQQNQPKDCCTIL